MWIASTSNEAYLRIMSMFEDHKCATFSLHIISQLGVDEGKPIGEWYGPNTVAQVMRWVFNVNDKDNTLDNVVAEILYTNMEFWVFLYKYLSAFIIVPMIMVRG